MLAPWPAAVLLLAARSDHLTKSTVTLQQAADEGGALLVWVVVLAVVSAVAAVAFRVVADRTHVSAPVRRTAGWIVVAAAVAAAIAVFAAFGAPWTLADRAVDSFRSVPKQTGTDATGRLFDLSSNGRVEQWRVAIDQFEEQPGGGGRARGATRRRGTCTGRARARSRTLTASTSRCSASSASSGWRCSSSRSRVPLVAAVRARRRPLVTGAFAAYAAFLAHAAVDWDWELAGVTLVALVAAAALVVSARGGDREVAPRSVAVRVALPAVTAALALLALAAVLSTVPLGRARDAYNRLDFEEAATQAQKAADWAPWSSEALDVLGRAQLAQGQIAKARSSFGQAVEKSPNDWELWRDLAAASPPAQARAALRRALALNPLEAELKQLQETLAPGA